MATKKTECIICAELYTSKSEATCVYCSYTTCRTCVRQYVLNETEPKCMNCKKPWTREHQNAVLKPAFVNKELKKHLEQVMFDRERAQFPATISVIEDRRQLETFALETNLLRREMETLSSNYRYVTEKARQNQIMTSRKNISPKFYPDKTLEQLEREEKEIEEELKYIRLRMNQVGHKIATLTEWSRMPYDRRQIAIENHVEGVNPVEIMRANPASHTAEKRKFVRACPIESCRGFLSTQWKCGICGIHTCPKCHVPKQALNQEDASSQEDTHQCNPDDVATAELLDQDTRPCPQCGTGIFKIDGCDQMWCTECHCAFSWRTGQIENGNLHNPHYFEYQRRIGRNARNVMDMPCDALNPGAYHGIIYALITNVISHKSNEKRKAMNIEPLSRETISRIRQRTSSVSTCIEHFVRLMTRYRMDVAQNNQELRVKYLTEEIDDAQFRSQLTRDTKKFNKDREIGQVMQTVVYAITDILNRLVAYLRENNNLIDEYNLSSAEKITEILSESDALMDYANECLAKICVEYKVVRVGIFIRNAELNYHTGLYSVRVVKQEDGTETILPKGLAVQA